MTKTSFAFYQGKPIVEVKLHGLEPLRLKMIVDTGADLVTAPPWIVKRMEWSKIKQQFVVVPGARIEVSIYAGEIEFQEVRRKVNVMAIEIPGLRIVDGLLGREFLDLFEVCFTGGQQVSFEHLEK